MQNFMDTVTGQLWAYEDDVRVSENNGVYSFATKRGVPLNAPTTLVPYTPPVPSAAELVSQAQSAQIAAISKSARLAEQIPLSYMPSSVSSPVLFPMDPHSWTKYAAVYSVYVIHGMPLPSGFNLFDINGRSVSADLADISGLFMAGMAQIDEIMNKRAALIAQIDAATTINAVKSIIWS